MLLKRIHAPSLQEALEKVERECGKNALLVDTRLGRSGYTIVAARETDAVRTPRAGSRSAPRWTRGFAEIADRATRFGLGAGVLSAVEKALIGTRVHLGRPGDPAVERLTARILKSLIKTRPFDLPRFHATALVGPTGVGKTTTLAKLAASCAREHGESVAIVTTDTYRIAAVDQLRAYADMLGVPFAVAFTPADLHRIVREHEHTDRILIDTSGHGPFDRESANSLRGTLASCQPATLLCLPAGGRRIDLEAQFDGFELVDPDAVIITKWDETSAPGGSVSIAVERGVPISHVTVGQKVPEDIVVADPGVLTASALSLGEREAEDLL